MRDLPKDFTHDQLRNRTPRPLALWSSALTTGPHTPTYLAAVRQLVTFVDIEAMARGRRPPVARRTTACQVHPVRFQALQMRVTFQIDAARCVLEAPARVGRVGGASGVVLAGHLSLDERVGAGGDVPAAGVRAERHQGTAPRRTVRVVVAVVRAVKRCRAAVEAEKLEGGISLHGMPAQIVQRRGTELEKEKITVYIHNPMSNTLHISPGVGTLARSHSKAHNLHLKIHSISTLCFTVLPGTHFC
jgi:hypothetical protein